MCLARHGGADDAHDWSPCASTRRIRSVWRASGPPRCAGTSPTRPPMASVSCRRTAPRSGSSFHPGRGEQGRPEPHAPRSHDHLASTTRTSRSRRLLELGGRHLDIGQSPDDHACRARRPRRQRALCHRARELVPLHLRTPGSAVNCDGSREVGYFWSDALGWPLVWDQDEETAIRSPDGTGPFITWGGGPDIPKVGKNRLHLDIAPSSTAISRPRSTVSSRSERPESTSARAPSTGSSWPIPTATSSASSRQRRWSR